MSFWHHLNLFIHMFAATAWVGGAVWLAMLDPILRRLEPRDDEPRRVALARRFRVATWHSAGLLIATGMGNLYFAHAFDDFGAYMRGRPPMHWKLTLVFVMLVVKYLHDYVYGKRALAETAANPAVPSPAARTARRLALLNLVLGILVLWFAVAVRS